MATEKYLLQDGSTLEITTTDKTIAYKESVVTTVDKVVNYEEVTTKIIPAVSFYIGLPKSDTLVLSAQSNRVIENIRISNAAGIAAQLTNCGNITFRNCFFDGAGAEAITLYNCKNILIEKCLFARVTTGVYASTSQSIKILNNQFLNVRRREGVNARGQFVQFDNVSGAGNEVSGNKGENFIGESNPEDLISMFKSNGTAASPIQIRNNMFKGGGPSASGGGIILGDFGGSYITADGNVLLNPGNYGMSIAGGSNMVITNNKIFSKQFPWSNNPLFIWEQSGSVCANNTIKSNRATWTDKDGKPNGGWNAGNCVNTIWEKPTPITEAELNVPVHLIDYVTPEELIKIRK